jgi:hypothetical protein
VFSKTLTPIQRETTGKIIILYILNGPKVRIISQNCAVQRRVEYKMLSSYPHLKQGTGSWVHQADGHLRRLTSHCWQSLKRECFDMVMQNVIATLFRQSPLHWRHSTFQILCFNNNKCCDYTRC